MDGLLLSVLRGVGVPAGALVPDVAGHWERDHLLGLDGRLAAVPSIVVTEGSVVHRVTVVVSHEGLASFDAV